MSKLRLILALFAALGFCAVGFAFRGSAGVAATDQEVANLYGGATGCMNWRPATCGTPGVRGCNGASGFVPDPNGPIKNYKWVAGVACGGTCGTVCTTIVPCGS